MIAKVFEADNNFKVSNGWLEKWKERHNVKSYAIFEESENVDMIDKAEKWKAFLASLCYEYIPADIFNMDETGYFDHALPNSTLNQVSKSRKG